jgi:Leucine-rich repeat (LRR) protein
MTEEKKRDATGKRIQNISYDSEAYMETLKKNKKIMVEFVGFDEIWSKINNMSKIQSISLAECKICDLGPKGHLSSILANLRILSMEDNLISDWNQVFQLGL